MVSLRDVTNAISCSASFPISEQQDTSGNRASRGGTVCGTHAEVRAGFER